MDGWMGEPEKDMEDNSTHTHIERGERGGRERGREKERKRERARERERERERE